MVFTNKYFDQVWNCLLGQSITLRHNNWPLGTTEFGWVYTITEICLTNKSTSFKVNYLVVVNLFITEMYLALNKVNYNLRTIADIHFLKNHFPKSWTTLPWIRLTINCLKTKSINLATTLPWIRASVNRLKTKLIDLGTFNFVYPFKKSAIYKVN